MEININKVNEATRELEIIVPKNEFEEELEAEFRTAQQYISIKGFRKGRVPLKLIKQMYGNEIERDFIGDYATKLFKEATEKNEISFIGKPFLKDIKKNDDKVVFTFAYDVIPQFELKDYKNLKIYEPIHKVTDEEIEHEINHRRLYSANVQDSEEIKNEHTIVTIDIIPIDQETFEPIPNGKVQSTTILLNSETVPPDLKQMLLNKKKGDEIIYYPHATDPSAPDEKVKIKIKHISELILEEFNDEFVVRYTNGRLQNTEEFKEEIGYFLQEKWDMKTNDEMVKQVIKKLVESHEFDLPQTVLYETALKLCDDFLKKYGDNYPQLKGKKPEDIIEDFIPIAESQVKWAIIKKKIIEKENLQLEDYDIESIVEEHKRQNPEADENELKKYIKSSPHIVDTLMEKKVLDFLISFAETTEIDFDDYQKMLQETLHHSEEETEDTHYHEPNETTQDSQSETEKDTQPENQEKRQ
ncbi:MAG: trigger factor [Ignavibacteria bacterium]|nr:trigger factor [Ignavibacteria bacterium]